MERRLQFPVGPENVGMTVERYLMKVPGFTRTQVKRLKFRERGICVNGERARVTRRLERGDVVSVRLEDVSRRETYADGKSAGYGEICTDGKCARCSEICTEEESSAHQKLCGENTSAVPAGGGLDILYEDADVIAVWKPSGLVVHPAHGHYGDTLTDLLRAYFAGRGEAVRVRSIGRLDSDTSGILVFAKNQVSAQRLWRQRGQGIFYKEYRALCEGVFPEEAQRTVQKTEAPIGHEPGELMKMCVSSSGKPAVTWYRVLEQREDTALVQLRLGTGRTHQIRVHMAALGHPLVGDALYGNRTAGKTHACLTAFRAEFCQPFSGEKIVLERVPEF